MTASRQDAPLPQPWARLAWPLCALYGAAMRGRAALYRRGWARSHALAAPVVAVGNLTAGGTGKTPVVEHLARAAAAAGRRPAVLSRGYGRRGRSALLRVRLADGGVASPRAMGDEPCWLSRRNPELSVYVGASRVLAARLAATVDAPDLLLLDDAYQHLAVRRQLNLLLVDAARGLDGGRVLPCGYLREPPVALRRADAVILTRANLGDPDAVAHELATRWGLRAPCFRFDYLPTRLTRLDGAAEEDPARLAGREVGLACAIARPESFRTVAGACGARVAHLVARPDHDPFDDDAVQALERRIADSGPHLPWLTTEKDAVKLQGRLSRPERLWVLEMAVRPGADWEARFAAFLDAHPAIPAGG